MISNAAICELAGLLDSERTLASIILTFDAVEATVERFQRTFAINTLGMFLCYKYAAKQMIEQGRGGRHAQGLQAG